MNMKRSSIFVLLAAGAFAAGCTRPIDSSLGVVVGDFSVDYGSAAVAASYKQQYTIHEAFVVSAGYANPWDWDATTLQADFISFGRIPEASESVVYVGFGLGLAVWGEDSPTGHDVDFWLRVPIGVLRRSSEDNGEFFIEAAVALGLDNYTAPFITYGVGLRRTIQ